MDNKQYEVNLTRGFAYRHGYEYHDDNARYMEALLKDFKVKLFSKNKFFLFCFYLFIQESRCSNYYCKF